MTTSFPWVRKMLVNFGFFLFALVAAVGFGMYVYPTQPLLVWVLLIALWGCYRLHRRAVALFSIPAHEK